MIPIKYTGIADLLDIHHKAIKAYLEGNRMKKKFARLESLIGDFTSKKYNFEKLVKANFSQIKGDIVPMWDAYSLARKTSASKELQLMKNLYTYLGNNGHYKFTDKSGTLINYTTNYIFEHLKLNVCPYCNENYTYYFTANGKRNYDLDHFFSQDDYPVLAASFYNWVPSCKVCNFFKKNDVSDILSPHETYRINDVFSWMLTIHSSSFYLDESAFDISCNYKGVSAPFTNLNNNVTVFQLENRYKKRKDIVSDTLRRRFLYSDDYVAQLFEDYEGRLFNSIDEVKAMAFGASLQEDDFGLRPFSKLIFDMHNAAPTI